MSQIYIIITLVTLAVIAGLLILTKRMRPASKLSPLAGLSFAFVIAGICFGEYRLMGYCLMGVGVLLAVADMIQRSKR